MDNPPPVIVENTDAENLNLLAVFHYVVGGIGFLFACLPFIHLAIGIALILSPRLGATHGDPMPAVAGYLLAGAAAFFILLGWTVAICTVISGRLIAKRRRRTFSFVIGATLCALPPFGTVLGVFTLIFLNQESIKELYARTA